MPAASVNKPLVCIGQPIYYSACFASRKPAPFESYNVAAAQQIVAGRHSPASQHRVAGFVGRLGLFECRHGFNGGSVRLNSPLAVLASNSMASGPQTPSVRIFQHGRPTPGFHSVLPASLIPAQHHAVGSSGHSQLGSIFFSCIQCLQLVQTGRPTTECSEPPVAVLAASSGTLGSFIIQAVADPER